MATKKTEEIVCGSCAQKMEVIGDLLRQLRFEKRRAQFLNERVSFLIRLLEYHHTKTVRADNSE